MNKFIDLSLLAVIAGLSGIVTCHLVYSDSPPFARQQIIDYPMDWYGQNTSQDYFSDPARTSYIYANQIFHAENVSDISSVTSASDGKILNVTFWLNGPFNESPVKTSPAYYIRFDTDSNLHTGDKFGADYLFIVTWNNETHSWEKTLEEFSPKTHLRVMQNTNLTNFYSKLDSNIITGKANESDYLDCCYVSLPVDLKMMNYPKSYAMSFHIRDTITINQTVDPTMDILINENNKLREPTNERVQGDVQFLDSTADVSIPTPTYEISKESQTINLTENRKSVPLFINSISESPAYIVLSVDNKTMSGKLISLLPKKTQIIEPHGKAKFDLTYNGQIDNVSSFLLPVNISVYPRIYSENPDKLTYSSTPTITTSSIIVYLTGQHHIVPVWIYDWIDKKTITVFVLTLVIPYLIRKRHTIASKLKRLAKK